MVLQMDKVLIEGILKKDEESIKHFVQAHQDQVFHQAYRMLGKQQDAEEACQDVFLKAISNMHDLKQESKLSTWLYRITYTTCLDVLKKRKRKPVEEDIDTAILPSWMNIENVISKIEADQQRNIIDRAIEQLTGTDALLIDLFYLKELSIQEIAGITEMTKSTIKVRLFRASQKLAVILKRSLPLDTLKRLQND